MIKLLLFKDHQGDLLGGLIKAVCRGSYVHAALLLDEPSLTIWEEYWPRVRTRTLKPSELPGIDVFAITGLTPRVEEDILAYCHRAIAARESYSIVGLLRFSPLLRWIIGEARADGISYPAFCSQAAFEAIHAGGITLLKEHSWEVSPQALATSPFLTLTAPLQATP